MKEEEDSPLDPRTRRVSKSRKVYDDAPKPKDTAELERQKSLFRSLVKSPEYAALKGLAYALCIYRAQPDSLDSAIGWHFSAVRRTAMDILFNKIEELGKDIAPEDVPVVNKTRPSFFLDNTQL